MPAIRHHHERFDGTRLPGRARRRGHPARRADHPRRRRVRLDAHDAHLPPGPARSSEALAELQRKAGAQFCPRCVGALERDRRPRSRRAPSRPPSSPRIARARPERATGALAIVAVCSTILGMARKRSTARSRGSIPTELAAFQAGIRRRYTDEQILAELRASRGAARPLADDAGVRGRPGDDGAPADGDRALRHLERGEARGRARAAAVRDARGAARAAARARRRARPHADGAATSTSAAGRCRRSRSTGTRSARSRRRCARPGFDVAVGEERLERAVEQGAALARALGRLPKFADWAEARGAPTRRC